MAVDKTAQPGIGTDRYGGPLVDPTANVIALNEASVRRLDDLRIAESLRINQALDYEAKLRDAESRRVDEQARLRSEFADKLANAEAKRIDAIRAVDVNAVAVASQRSADQATVLANQVVQSAEALRALVASTAAAQAQTSSQSMSALSDRVAAVEKKQYEDQGKQGVVDPLQAVMVAEIKALRQEVTAVAGQKQGGVDMRIWIFGAIAALAALFVLFQAMRGR